MLLQMKTDQACDKPLCSAIETSLEHELWIVDQLTILAEALGESGERVSPQRLEIYARELADVNRAHLEVAFARARRESKFFPKIAEVRELAGEATERDRGDVEANAAFQAVIHGLERNGVDAGIRHLPDRVQFAVRQCGGLFQFNQRLQVQYGDDENPSRLEWRSEIFLRKDFVAAYKSYSVHKSTLPELTEKGLNALPAPARRFLGEGQQKPALCGSCGGKIKSAAPPPARGTQLPTAKYAFTIPEALTPAQIRDRREILRQQAEFLKAKKSAEGAA
jgi:hypothetical protein